VNSTRLTSPGPTAGAKNRAGRMAKELAGGKRRHGGVPSVMIVAGCCGLVVVVSGGRQRCPYGSVPCLLGAEASVVVAAAVVALCTRMRSSARRVSRSSIADTRSACSR
jgi:hypothetical protein